MGSIKAVSFGTEKNQSLDNALAMSQVMKLLLFRSKMTRTVKELF